MKKRLLLLMIPAAMMLGCEKEEEVLSQERSLDCQEQTWKEGLACIEIYDPVCGCNNKTYSNACFAQGYGVSVSYQGECKN